MPWIFSKKQIFYLRIIGIIGTLFCMTAIFLFSAQDGEKSGALSGGLLHMLLQFFLPQATPAEYEWLSFFIRKCAHFSIYTATSIFLSILAVTFPLSLVKKLIFVLMAGFLYAVSDEIHQLFIPGRAGSFKDVLIDTCGVLVGMSVTFLCFYFVQKKKNKT
ncbi:VanZ family protein [Scatolibacter rhodanostii]|uniref:VanZ family protein n=1 Tax=Scatolibacter rhodanostii TaxID=2014781 RepID=UPI00117FA2EB|nr:VanZ family protein [Scatolibacter rhodanostii]